MWNDSNLWTWDSRGVPNAQMYHRPLPFDVYDSHPDPVWNFLSTQLFHTSFFHWRRDRWTGVVDVATRTPQPMVLHDPREDCEFDGVAQPAYDLPFYRSFVRIQPNGTISLQCSACRAAPTKVGNIGPIDDSASLADLPPALACLVDIADTVDIADSPPSFVSTLEAESASFRFF